MMSRRTLIAAGTLGSLAALPGAAEAGQGQDERNAERIAGAVRGLDSTLEQAFTQNSLSFGAIGRIRQNFEQFLRANAKFPDFCEVGSGVFFEVYDWHVKNRQPLNVSRQPDGRYVIQFMFTLLILRPDTEPIFIGYPYDNR